MTQEEPAKESGNHISNDSDDIENQELGDWSGRKRLRIRECMDNLLVLNKIQGSLLSQMNKELQ